jgi:hypothetical protein
LTSPLSKVTVVNKISTRPRAKRSLLLSSGVFQCQTPEDAAGLALPRAFLALALGFGFGFGLAFGAASGLASFRATAI